MKFNTAIAALMALMNEISKVGRVTKGEIKSLLIMLNPIAPHMTEEMWEMLGFPGMISEQKWVEYDEAKTIDDEVEIVIQINGKIREKMLIGIDEDNEAVKEKALSLEKIQELTAGKTIVKVIVIPKKLVNIVVK